MAQRESKAQKDTIQRVMHEYKHGELKRGRGGKVRNRKQAVAIALSEAGASNQQSPGQNRRRLAATKRKERAGRNAAGKSRKELYAEARRRDVPGRSGMNKQELEKALRH